MELVDSVPLARAFTGYTAMLRRPDASFILPALMSLHAICTRGIHSNTEYSAVFKHRPPKRGCLSLAQTLTLTKGAHHHTRTACGAAGVGQATNAPGRSLPHSIRPHKQRENPHAVATRCQGLAFGMNTSALGFMLLTVSGGPASSSGLLVQRGLLASAPLKQS